MRFTADLAVHAAQRMNPLGEREVILRGYKIAAIENTGTLKDQFDVIDLSDNEITRVGNFAPARRLTTLLLHNNRVATIDDNLGDQLPSLETLMLCHNRLESLTQLAGLNSLKKLQHLSCIGNPIKRLEHYRSFLIATVPSLKTLDFKKIKAAEREKASQLFPEDGESTADLTLVSATADAAQPPPPPPRSGAPPAALANLTAEQKAAIRRAVANASTPAEVDALERQLRAGVIPGMAPPGPPPRPGPARSLAAAAARRCRRRRHRRARRTAAGAPPAAPRPRRRCRRPRRPRPRPAPPAPRASTGSATRLPRRRRAGRHGGRRPAVGRGRREDEGARPAPLVVARFKRTLHVAPRKADLVATQVTELARAEARPPTDGLKKVLKERLPGGRRRRRRR